MKSLLKIHLLLLPICLVVVSAISFGQSNLEFKFQIWKNSTTTGTFLGTFTFTPGNTLGTYYGTSTDQINANLCPGDELIFKNLTKLNGANHDFTGNSQDLFSKLTIGLTGDNTCSSSSNSVPLHPLGSVCGSITNPCITGVPAQSSWNSWVHGATSPIDYKSITIPNISSGSANYLMISASIIGQNTPICTCGDRYFFIKLNNYNEGPETLENLSICPGETVNLNLNPDYTYNWITSNPDGTIPVASQDYIVQISSATSCTPVVDTFSINVIEPAIELINNPIICSNDLPYAINPWLSTGNFYPTNIWINGQHVFNFNTSDGLIYITQTGLNTITYEYAQDGKICSKTYQVMVGKNPKINLGSNHFLCEKDEMPVIDGYSPTVSTYSWTYTPANGGPIQYVLGSPSSVNTANYGFGTYTLTASDLYGCSTTQSVQVLLSSSAGPNQDASFNATITASTIGTTATISMTANQQFGSHHWYIYTASSPNGPWSYFGGSVLANPSFTGVPKGYYLMYHMVGSKPCFEYASVSETASFGTKKKFEPKTIELTVDEQEELLRIAHAASPSLAVSIYPNPNEGQFTIELSELDEHCSIEVTSLTGRVIYAKSSVEQLRSTIDVSQFAKGVYIVKVTSGGKTSINKVVYR